MTAVRDLLGAGYLASGHLCEVPRPVAGLVKLVQGENIEGDIAAIAQRASCRNLPCLSAEEVCRGCLTSRSQYERIGMILVNICIFESAMELQNEEKMWDYYYRAMLEDAGGYGGNKR